MIIPAEIFHGAFTQKLLAFILPPGGLIRGVASQLGVGISTGVGMLTMSAD